MASTNKTANLSLNQWTLDDPFLMEDFNADNRKLDAAIGGVESRKMEFIKLKDITTTEGNISQIEIDVSDIVFADWQFLIIDVNVSIFSFLATDAPATLISFQNSNNVSSRGIAHVDAGTRVILFTNKGLAPRVSALSMGSYCLSSGFTNSSGFSLVKKLYVRTPETTAKLDPGARFVFWGVK